MAETSRRVPEIIFRNRALSEGHRTVAEESAIALSYGGSTEAVMMATPSASGTDERSMKRSKSGKLSSSRIVIVAC